MPSFSSTHPAAGACCALALSLLLVACGGGGDGDKPTATPEAMRAAPSAQQAAPVTPDASALMNWAQTAYPGLFPGNQPNQVLGPFIYRYYPETQNYLGVAGSDIYVMGPVSGGVLRAVGSIGDYACNIDPATCPTTTPDSLGGTYTAYATNGQRFTLDLDFSSTSYSFTGLTVPGYASAGTFASGSEGNHVFNTGSGVGNVSFRGRDGLVVGSYDFGDGVQPFVAGRRFATSAAEAAGTYNNLGVNHTAAGVGDSTIYSSRIDAGGTLRICNDNIVYTLDLCPAASVITYTLAINGETFTATSPGRDTYNFRVALAGTEKVYLMAAVGTVTRTRYFRIGVLESAGFASGAAYGATTLGEFGRVAFTSSSYSSSGIAADGHAISLTGTLSTMGTSGPSGMRAFRSAGTGFAIQNTQLVALVGSRGGPSAGYMQIGGK